MFKIWALLSIAKFPETQRAINTLDILKRYTKVTTARLTLESIYVCSILLETTLKIITVTKN